MKEYYSSFVTSKLPGVETLKKTSDFARVRREGRSWASSLVVLNVAPNGFSAVRCGFITGKKIGGAVERNRARRLMKEAIRLRLPLIKPGFDLVFIGRGAIVEAKGDAVARDIDSILNRGRLYSPSQLSEAPQPETVVSQ